MKKNNSAVSSVEDILQIMHITNVAPLYYTNKDGEETMNDVADEFDLFDEVANKLDTVMLLKDIKEILTPREYKIILLRFGFDGKVRTLDEIGKLYKLTRERIRQIEAKALEKLNKVLRRKYNEI